MQAAGWHARNALACTFPSLAGSDLDQFALKFRSAIFFVGPPQIQRSRASRGALCGNLSNCAHQIFDLLAAAILFHAATHSLRCTW